MSRHEVQILRAVGMAQAAVASKTGVSVQSVRRIEREAPVTTSERQALVRQHRVGRPSVAAPWTAMIEGWLAEARGLPSGEIVRRLREEQGYAGGKSAVTSWCAGCGPFRSPRWCASRVWPGSSASMTSARSRCATPAAGGSGSASSPAA